MDTLQALNEIFCRVFDDNTIKISHNTTSSDIESWDSLNNINLAIALEQHFKIKIALGEMQKLKNVGELINMIEIKIKSCK